MLRPSAKHARFGFALAIKLDPDVLLVDEVMAVDDEPFQKKCMQQIGKFRSDGKTNILVSHSPEAVKEACVRACVLNHGTLFYYRLIDPGSEWRLHRLWFDRSAMGQLLGKDYALVEKNALYRWLDKVGNLPLPR